MINETIQATLNKTGKGKIFFITDPHFGHINLCKAIRGMTAEESDNLIIKNWNSVVKSPYDTVYIGGDLTMEKPQLFERVISKLNGRKVIIGGNHDDRKSCELYQKLGITSVDDSNAKMLTGQTISKGEIEAFPSYKMMTNEERALVTSILESMNTGLEKGKTMVKQMDSLIPRSNEVIDYKEAA